MSDRLLRRENFYIDGEWKRPTDRALLEVVSPSSEEVIGSAALAVDKDIDAAVAAGRRAFDTGGWPQTTPVDRALMLERIGKLIGERADDIRFVTTEEMGCPVRDSLRAQTGLVASVFEYYANLIRSFEFERSILVGTQGGVVNYLPVGVVAVVIPWNAPVTLAAWKIAPALAAGCSVVMKPAPEAPLSNYILAEACEQAGLPAGVVNVVPGGRGAGEHLVTHSGVDKVAFTGSTATGKRIMELCANRMARVSLELGGKSAAIILDDAEMSSAIPAVVEAGMHLSGQVCASLTRVLVPRTRYSEAADLAGSVAASVKVGDPHDPATVVGPLAAERQRARVEEYIRLAIHEGGRIAAGGGRPPHLDKGWYVEPTIIVDVTNTSRVAQEEIFGPVLCLIPYDDEDDAIRLANESRFGLAGGVWGADEGRALSVARRLQAGSVVVNGCYPPFPFVPFGGLKESGIGRELGPEGLLSFLELQSIGVPEALARR
jgi:acyl-CoA reductase-like NAD-dependent aldehyde dehydrogenase